jgi:hypothetical protein
VLDAHEGCLEARLVRLRGDRHVIRDLPTDRGEATVSDEPEFLDHRRLAAALFNGTWELMDKQDRTPADDDRMLHMAHASRHHWGEVGNEANVVRGEWQCSRVYAVLRRPEPCLHHAERALALCRENDLADWDLAFCHEALARGYAVAGDHERARSSAERALAVDIAENEDRALLLADLETIPGLDRFW